MVEFKTRLQVNLCWFIKSRCQLCLWHCYVGDLMMMTILWFWWQKSMLFRWRHQNSDDVLWLKFHYITISKVLIAPKYDSLSMSYTKLAFLLETRLFSELKLCTVTKTTNYSGYQNFAATSFFLVVATKQISHLI